MNPSHDLPSSLNILSVAVSPKYNSEVYYWWSSTGIWKDCSIQFSSETLFSIKHDIKWTVSFRHTCSDWYDYVIVFYLQTCAVRRAALRCPTSLMPRGSRLWWSRQVRTVASHRKHETETQQLCLNQGRFISVWRGCLLSITCTLTQSGQDRV